MKQKTLRRDRTAAERKVPLRSPPQAENLACEILCFIGSCVSIEKRSAEDRAVRVLAPVWEKTFL
ncbi:MAG: hypothetical protein Q4C48_03980 [Lachnospiraceae bacterium]|nr:hypothetical protein [Lachnospiraceae bacterium]